MTDDIRSRANIIAQKCVNQNGGFIFELIEAFGRECAETQKNADWVVIASLKLQLKAQEDITALPVPPTVKATMGKL